MQVSPFRMSDDATSHKIGLKKHQAMTNESLTNQPSKSLSQKLISSSLSLHSYHPSLDNISTKENHLGRPNPLSPLSAFFSATTRAENPRYSHVLLQSHNVGFFQTFSIRSVFTLLPFCSQPFSTSFTKLIFFHSIAILIDPNPVRSERAQRPY